MKNLSSKLRGSLTSYLLALLARWNYNLTYPLMMYATCLSKFGSNLREKSHVMPLLLKALPITLKLKPQPNKSMLLTWARGLLVSLLQSWKERNDLSVIVFVIFKLIVSIKDPLPSSR